jgi:5-methylcytosine-specific restriction endonuclease McrA
MLREYAPVSSKPKFCRRSILLRDKFCCQYCGKKHPQESLSYDHLIPRAKGGKTTWNNIVTACLTCNAAKADTMPNLSGRKGKGEMRPLKMPRQPSTAELLRAGMELLDPQIREDFNDFLYYNVELEQ